MSVCIESTAAHTILIEGLGACGLPSTLSVRVDGGLRCGRIRDAIARRCPRLPAHAFMLTLDGKLLRDDDEEDGEDGDSCDAPAATSASASWSSSSRRLSAAAAAVDCASSPLVMRVVFRSALVGGKGGFGSLLRTATTKVGAKKTDNFSASRDLSGRRMRHVEAERAIAQWNAQHHEPVDQRELNAKFKAIKEGRPVDVKPCKWGPTCKYRYSTCRLEHGEDPNAAAFARPPPVTSMSAVVPMPEVSAKDLSVSSSHMEHAVSAGLQSSKKRMRGRAASATDVERKEQSDDDDQSDYEQDAYSSSSSSAGSDDEDAPAPKRLHTAAASSSSAAAAAAAASSSSAADAVPLSAVYAATYVAPTPSFPSITHRAPDLDAIDGKQAQMGLAAVMAKVKAKQHANGANGGGSASNGDSPPAPAAASAAAASSSHGAIDLAAVGSVAELLRFDAAHLAHELTRVGMKAGGTHEQKAQRLFMLKGTTIDKLPKKVLAAA